MFETVNPHEGVPAPNLNEGAHDNRDDLIDIGADIDPQNWERFQEELRKQKEEAEAKSGRGPDLQPGQHQPRVMDSAAGENIKDWTIFDISRSLRILRVGTIEHVEREVRKLHLRSWHATRKDMEETLKAAGMLSKILDRIAGIIDTCRECRAWTSSKPDVTPTVELVMKQNERIEADILFYKKSKAFNHGR